MNTEFRAPQIVLRKSPKQNHRVSPGDKLERPWLRRRLRFGLTACGYGRQERVRAALPLVDDTIVQRSGHSRLSPSLSINS